MKTDILGRVKNMVYTTSERYDTKVKMSGHDSFTDTERTTIATTEAFMRMGLTEEEALALVMNAAGHEGGHNKLSDMKPIRDVMARAKSEGADLKILNPLLQIAEDYRVDSTIARERPGYWQRRNEVMKLSGKMFKDRPSKDSIANFTKAVSFFTHNDTDLRNFGWSESVVDWEDARETARDLEKIASESKNSTELIENIYSYYKERYVDDPSEGGGDDDDEGDDDKSDKSDKKDKSESRKGGSSAGEKSGSTSTKGKSKGTSEESESKGEPEDSETSERDTDEDAEEDTSDDTSDASGEDSDEDDDGSGEKSDSDELSEEDKKELEDAISELEESFKGSDTLKDLMGDAAKDRLEREKRKDVSKFVDMDDYTKSAEKERKNYMSTYNYKSLWSPEDLTRIQNELCVGNHLGADIMYVERTKGGYDAVTVSTLKALNGQARKMGTMLAQVLKADADERGEIATSGSKIIANRVWKPLNTGSTEVFYKRDYTEVGGYVIDLVLDASGSQRGRVEDIAKQAYIIAQACSVAGIPCRVSQFDTKSSFTVLERLRDFDDAEARNLNCNKYSAMCDNRDGLALMIANVELQKRKEQNKVMIVLSDGAPQDNSGYYKINAFGGLGNYNGGTTIEGATLDVCNTVQAIRKSGTALMGIYVGSGKSTLEIEKIMYGNNFAYIKEMDTFVDVVMKYLVRHIQGMDR